MKTKLLLHAWAIKKKNKEYYLPYTHWNYLNEIVTYFDEIVLLSSCQKLSENTLTSAISIKIFANVSVYELPMSNGYVGAIKHFYSYYKAYKSIKNVTTYYARYPVPFGWLQKVFGKNKNRIIHYVGDPVDAAINNPNFSKTKKRVLVTAFKPENALYDWACKGAKVFTNGFHIAEKLRKKSIQATPLISSTLNEDDFFINTEKKLNRSNIKFVYLGNLRTAKGVETVLKSFKLFNEISPNSSLTLIGSGEFENKLKEIVNNERIKNVNFKGRIDDRLEINKILRNCDIFLFASLSEGSPRVILEAMANGLFVISTPVGSLPKIFKDKRELLFANFNDSKNFFEKIKLVIDDEAIFKNVRSNAFKTIKGFTLRNFINTIFNEK